MPVIELDSKNFIETVQSNDVVFVDFWAPWCGPCRSFAPVYEEVAEQNPNVVFTKVNTEVEQELAARFNIRSIPTLMVFREQIILYSEAGALPKNALEQLVQQVNDLNMEQVRREIEQEESKQQSS